MKNRKDALSPIAIRAAHKVLPYTITLIGGLEALAKHQIEVANRKAYERENKARNEALRAANAIRMVEEQLSTVQFTKAEREEIATLAIRGRIDAITAGYGVHSTSECLEQLQSFLPKKSFLTRCKDWVSSIWLDANFSK